MNVTQAPVMQVTLRRSETAVEVIFPTKLLLAPMEGVTDRTFRSLVLDLGGVGGASTEFLRISSAPIPQHVVARELGPGVPGVPVAVQIMSPGLEHLAETVANAEAAGAAWIDLNFGCPVARVCGKGAGSALLADPPLLGRIVAEAARATTLPVTAKIRAGIEDTSPLLDVVDAAAEAGAAMLTVHGRRRVDGYDDPANWDWIAAAAARWRSRAAGPVCGNGGVATPDDARRMLRETGCDLVMIGRGAIANPFVFREFAGQPPASPAEAASFALAYADAIAAGSDDPRRGAGRVKQLVRYYTAGGVLDGDPELRRTLLRAPDAAAIREHFERFLESGANRRST